MTDIWSFLIQSLTATTVAVFILAIKKLFQYKISPLWQFSVWAVLLISLVVPYGVFGGTVIIDWRSLTEFLKTYLFNEYTLSKSYTFFPFLTSFSFKSVFDIIFTVYYITVLFFMGKYAVSYIRLRAVLKTAERLSQDEEMRLREIAYKYSLELCRCVKCRSVSTPFICGLVSPVLVLPEKETDEKVILHELLHLKHKDVLWVILISVLRCIHWCNPVLWFAFNKINNDLEELCDFRVLQRLEGEQRRDYGNILLSMVNEKYACLPGTSSAANGGKNIASRIKTIASYKQYPVSSHIFNICIIIIIAVCLLMGNPTLTISAGSSINYTQAESDFLMTKARTSRCFTPAGAVDTYAKAVLQNNGYYRACCAPLSEHKAIAGEMKISSQTKSNNFWDSGLEDTPKNGFTYHLYNLQEQEKNSYTAILAFEVRNTTEDENTKIAYQEIKILKEQNRWIVIPAEAFRTLNTSSYAVTYSCFDLPVYRYVGENEDFLIERFFQHIITIDSNVENSDMLPDFYAEFGFLWECHESKITYKGSNKEDITRMSYGFDDMYDGEKQSSSTGIGGGDTSFNENNEKICGGGGGGGDFTKEGLKLPDYVSCTLSINSGAYEYINLYREDN